MDEETKSVSRKLEELARSWLSASGNDVAELEERKHEIKEKLEDVEEKKDTYETRMQDLRNKLQSLETAIDRKEQEESRIDNAVDDLVSEVPVRTPTGSRDAEDRVKQVAATPKFDQYLQKVDADRKELKEKLVAKVEA